MTCREIQHDVDDFVSGHLLPSERSRIERHLLVCSGCRSYVGWSRELASHASALPNIMEPSRDLWPGIASRLSNSQEGSAEIIALPTRTGIPVEIEAVPAQENHRFSRQPAIAAAFIILTAISALLTFSTRELPTDQAAWRVTGMAGAPMIGLQQATEGRPLSVGEWLETDAASSAEIEVGDLGQVELGPNSRLRVLRVEANEHRMALDKGSMSALILAPPRLFLVETPSALAVDLGCAYELTVDDQGNGHLVVTAGWVAFESQGRQSLVPAGASCVSRRGLGPGTPYFVDSTTAFKNALDAVDTARSADVSSLESIIRESRARDTLSLWHLLPRLPQEQRELVWKRLNELLPAPLGVTREGVLELNQDMLERWKDDLEQFWF